MEPQRSQVPASRLGQTVAQAYRIDALLGTGSMGHIYRAERLDGAPPVALKFLHLSAYRDEVALSLIHI